LSNSLAQETIIYKQVDTTQLTIEVHYPSNMDISKKYPGMVFFFGGGWKNGTLKHFEPHAKYFSKRGLVCFLVDYRVESRQGSTPFESLKDAKSAIRYLRANAEDFNLDPNKIIASGGSAGGHLAAAAGLVKTYDETSDDMTISAKPDALVLFNPVIDNGPGGYGYERIGGSYKDFSPLHNIEEGAPPTVLFLGTEDKLIPMETANYYQTVMQKVGSRCDLHVFDGEGHGFFNYSKFENYKETVSITDQFLQSLGYLEEKPKIKID
jgi:acetyl esterase/lipase